MGNCLVLQENVVKVMKTDGKILEYKTPLKVQQVLSEFAHHAISDKLPVVSHLSPKENMHGGRLYYLLPLPVPPPPTIKKKNTKKVRFADTVEEAGAKPDGVVRIKIVISKQELQAMLEKEGLSMENEGSKIRVDKDGDMSYKAWSPALEIIHEGD